MEIFLSFLMPAICPSPINVTAASSVSEPPDLYTVASEYRDVGEVFSNLYLHITLVVVPLIIFLEHTYLPVSCIIHPPERGTMEKYINDSLAVCTIQPSSSPVGAGFFVSKKDGSVHPCINYQGYNITTINNNYHLPLINLAFDPHRATVFTKLDLKNTYPLVMIREGDEWKTTFNSPHHFKYLVTPFSLTNTPAVFEDLENDVLRFP